MGGFRPVQSLILGAFVPRSSPRVRSAGPPGDSIITRTFWVCSEPLISERAIALGDFLATLLKGSRIGEILRESLTIGGWVSMWRPLEVFLYDWWPVRNEARLSDRLAAMPVRIRYANATGPEAWKEDWPAVSPRERKANEADQRTLNSAR